MTGRPPAALPGLVLDIMVDDQPVGVDAPEITARFRDPARNVIGLYQEPSSPSRP